MSASCQPDTTHLLFSPCTADYVISFLQNTAESESLRDRGELWVERKNQRPGKGEKSRGGSKLGDTEITAQRQEAELQGPLGLGSMCRHNELSQTYPASLISTIKAIFSAQHVGAFSPVCQSHHLSPKIKTSEMEHKACGNMLEKKLRGGGITLLQQNPAAVCKYTPKILPDITMNRDCAAVINIYEGHLLVMVTR